MTRANDLHDVHSAAVLEQITRWAVADNWSDELSGETQKVVWAAEAAGREHFVGALASLAEHDGQGSRAAMLHATLQGNVDLIGHALADNEGLRSLYRTTAERAQGIDMAEIATPNGLRLRAEQTGEAYQTAVLVEDAPGRSDVLASSTITAATATDALRTAAQREHAVHGLDHTDLQLVDLQLARLDYLAAIETALPGAAAAPDPQPHAPWADTVTQIAGRDLRGEPDWTTLAATLDRAAAAGWDVAGQLPAAAAQAPLPTHGSVSHDLAYRVMDACPDSVPPAPSIAQINGTEVASTGRQREAAERAIRPTPAPDRGPTVGR
jgi:hypothetical protein